MKSSDFVFRTSDISTVGGRIYFNLRIEVDFGRQH